MGRTERTFDKIWQKPWSHFLPGPTYPFRMLIPKETSFRSEMDVQFMDNAQIY